VSPFANTFITGASSGIGRELALLLGSKASTVVLAARREAELGAVAEQIRARGGRAEVCMLDVADAHAVHQAVAHWDQATGGLDLVVANAGAGITRPAHKLRWEDIESVIQVNVLGAFATLHAAIEPMVRRRRGTLVGISSLAALRAFPVSGAYAASKAALASFLDTLRLDLGPYGVRVVDVRPGFVDTAMTKPNRFKMPLLMSAADAAARALEGIENELPVVAFPWASSAAMTALQLMPDRLHRLLFRQRRRPKP
jgi:short-subunit dehydrogenase